jgi:hypothetical protein
MRISTRATQIKLKRTLVTHGALRGSAPSLDKKRVRARPIALSTYMRAVWVWNRCPMPHEAILTDHITWNALVVEHSRNGFRGPKFTGGVYQGHGGIHGAGPTGLPREGSRRNNSKYTLHKCGLPRLRDSNPDLLITKDLIADRSTRRRHLVGRLPMSVSE